MTGRLLNGLALMVIGAVLLMNTTGYLPWSVWDAAFAYWPILLIGLGFQFVLSRRRIPALSVAVVIVLILGAMNPYAGGGRFWNIPNGTFFEFKLPSRSWKPMDKSKDWTAPLKPSVSEVELELKAPSLDIEARGNPGLNEESSPLALSAKIQWDRQEPSTTFKESQDRVKAYIEAPDLTGGDAGKQVWAIDLNPSLSTSLRISGGVANVSLYCDSVFLKDISVTAGVADLDLRLGLTGKDTRVNVSGGVASMDLKIPKAAGLRVTVSSPLTVTHDLADKGLTRSGNSWSTPEFESASTQIDVIMNCGTGTIKVERTD